MRVDLGVAVDRGGAAGLSNGLGKMDSIYLNPAPSIFLGINLASPVPDPSVPILSFLFSTPARSSRFCRIQAEGHSDFEVLPAFRP